MVATTLNTHPAGDQRRQHRAAGVVQGVEHQAVQPPRRGGLPGRHRGHLKRPAGQVRHSVDDLLFFTHSFVHFWFNKSGQQHQTPKAKPKI